MLKQFNLLGYLVHMSIARTMWVHTQSDQREDFFFKVSRTYVRDCNTYMYQVIIWKLNILIAKV